MLTDYNDDLPSLLSLDTLNRYFRDILDEADRGAPQVEFAHALSAVGDRLDYFILKPELVARIDAAMVRFWSAENYDVAMRLKSVAMAIAAPKTLALVAEAARSSSNTKVRKLCQRSVRQLEQAPRRAS